MFLYEYEVILVSKPRTCTMKKEYQISAMLIHRIETFR